jgi:hypothetical protein
LPKGRAVATKQLTLRVCLSGVLDSAASALTRFATDLREREGYDPDDPENVRDDPAEDSDWLAHMLKAIAEHARGVLSGLHTIPDFALHYCLRDEEQGGETATHPCD